MQAFSATSAVRRRNARLRRIGVGVAMTSALLAGAAAAQTYQFAFQVGGPGTGPGQFEYPQGVAIDRNNHRVLIDDGHLNVVEIFSTDGTYLSEFGGSGANNGQFDYPAGLRVDPINGDIVVADYFNGRVDVFSSAGVYLRQFGATQGATPCDVAIDPVTHHMFVPGGYAASVTIYDANGTYLSSFGSAGTGPGQFTYACSITFDTATSHVFVDDQINNNVQVFTAGGAYLGQFGTPGQGDGQFSVPAGMAIDPVSRDILIADYGNNRVQVFSPNGAYLNQFGAAGGSDSQFNGPDGVDIDPATNNVYVSDRGNARVEVFSNGSTAACGPTTVSLSVDPPMATLSQSLLFSALASIHSPFAGTVSFDIDGGGPACVANMDDVSASCLHPLELGTHSVVAQYSGDGNNPPGCSLPQQVTIVSDTTGAPTDVTCTTVPDPPQQGQPVQVVCTAVNPPGPNHVDQPTGGGITGYVSFAQGSEDFGSFPLVFGTATYTNSLAGGSYPLVATYSGDSQNASSSTDVTVVVETPDDDIFYGGFENPPQ